MGGTHGVEGTGWDARGGRHGVGAKRNGLTGRGKIEEAGGRAVVTGG